MLTAMIKYDKNSFRPEMKEAEMKTHSLILTSSLFYCKYFNNKRNKLMSTQYYCSHATVSNRTGRQTSKCTLLWVKEEIKCRNVTERRIVKAYVITQYISVSVLL